MGREQTGLTRSEGRARDPCRARTSSLVSAVTSSVSAMPPPMRPNVRLATASSAFFIFLMLSLSLPTRMQASVSRSHFSVMSAMVGVLFTSLPGRSHQCSVLWLSLRKRYASVKGRWG